ncbi:putative toxin-antitoxin system toxin component, PIN family, partial [Arthrospira platensis SPKY1]|nr:putative toxin-antitoxin system toxin component, PIN family [Arthrospira platensis SPKY1]
MGAAISRRVVLDTHTLVSALLFQQGRLAWLKTAWATGQLVPVVSKATTAELLRVLAYPKFQLSSAEQRLLLAEYLPYAETVPAIPADLALPLCKDAADQKFLELAYAARVEALVTGDGDLL